MHAANERVTSYEKVWNVLWSSMLYEAVRLMEQ